MRTLLIAVLALFPTAALPAISFDALHALVVKGDTAAVSAALAEAVAEDSTSGHEPDLQRGLFEVFELTHPDIDAFTANWLQSDPQSAYARVARGVYQFSMGWAMRGDGWAKDVHPDAMAELRLRHAEAFDLMNAATQIDPDLIAASDGILRLAQTLGAIDAIPYELEQVMQTQPNRGTTMIFAACRPVAVDV